MKSSHGELSGHAPIAITGIGCRFPGGVSDLDGFGRLLSDGGVIREVPADRWSPDYHDPSGSRRGTMVSDAGSFIDDIDRFDAGFFGISPREAATMDPQQRMLLEVCWEAMADSGRPREDWAGSRTAVFTGMLAGDYATLHAKTLGTEGIGTHYASGVEASFAAGRIGYVFDLHGPVAAISSACSSALLSVHLAAQSLRSGECDAALAGGVNLLLTPELSVFMSGIGAVSPSGTCRPFEAAADGVVRGEGCAVVVLRRLDDALADGDRVYAVLRGSAVNHDGSSLALTAPNALAQQALLTAALEKAGLRPGDVDFVEAHGTATPLGDHIELSTLADTYGADRRSGRPLLVGSHKAILGHTDAAAGLAGLLKAVWVVSRRRVPAQPALGELTPVLDWDTAGIEVPLQEASLEGRGRPVRAGVSAFGLSGTNVHAIIEEAPESSVGTPGAPRGPYLLVLSAGSQRGLAAQETRMTALAVTSRERGTLDDLVASAATRRTHGPHRRAIVAPDAGSLLAALAAPDGESVTGVVDPDEVPVPVFAFSGQGSQWPGMAADLLTADPVFAGWIGECDALIRGHAAWSLMDELRGADGRGLARTDIAQPAILAIQVAVTRWLAARGVRPSAVIGHGVGEIAAAHVAGALSLEDAIRLAVLRGELLHESAGDGRPAAVVAGLGPRLRERLDWLEPSPPRVRLLSSVTPDAEPVTLDAAYWERNLADPVLFWPATGRLLAGPPAALVEIGPDPVLTAPLTDAVRARGRGGPVIPTLRRGKPGELCLYRTLAGLHVAGVDIDFERVTGRPARYRTLPVPSWDGDRYWLPGVERGQQDRKQPADPASGTSVTDTHANGTSGNGTRANGTPANGATANGAPSNRTTDGAPANDAPADRVAAAVRQVLGFRGDQRVPRRRGLFELGLDSAGAVQLRERLETDFGVPLASTVVFEYPSIDELASYLAELAPPPAPRSAPVQPAPAGLASAARPASQPGENNHDDSERSGADSGVAIIGLACRLPGASCLEEFWALLTRGEDAIGPLPADRGQEPVWSQAGPGVPTRGGYLEDIAGFDAPFFRIAPREARSLDPQQRLFLEVASEALEDAGLPAEAVRGSAAGVYVGLNTTDYAQLLTRELSDVDLYYGTGNSFAATAGRLAYFLGLRGPAIAVDTACSASLSAVHLACQGLREGDCEVAIVGGANTIVAPTVSVSMAAGGALAPDGRCKSFDEAADGYGRGEGAVALVLKPLRAARRDRDRVYAVIRGSAVNADGASGGLTVPSGPAQTAVISRALRRAGWSPADVDYVEAHGTGTPLGDPIEVRALADAYGHGRCERNPLLLGSVKANIGHLEAAAGAAGLLKIVLALRHAEIPPHRVGTPSSRIDWDALPVRLTTDRRSWPSAGRPARAGISAFGFTGSNAHVLIEQPEPQREPQPERRRGTGLRTLVVTAATPSALRAVASRMAARLRGGERGEFEAAREFDALVYTAMCRRTWFPHRAAVTGTGPGELADALDAVAAGQSHPRVRTAVADDIEPNPFGGERAAVAAAAAAGGRPAPVPVSLPAYPWEHRRYWYRPEPETAPVGEIQAPPEPTADAVADERFFRIRWEQAGPEPGEAAPGGGAWALVGRSRLADDLARALGERGDRVTRLDVTGDAAAALSGLETPCRGIVLVADPASAADPAGVLDQDWAAHADVEEPGDLLSAVALGQAMAALPPAVGRLWIVTSGAHHPAAEHTSPAHTAVWEAGRVLAVEIPERWGGLIDIAAAADGPGTSAAIAAALRMAEQDDQLRFSAGGWEAARLVREEDMAPRRDGVDPDRWHVVLGGQEAWPALRSLVDCGARRLLLVGDVPAPAADATWSPVDRPDAEWPDLEWPAVEWEVCPPDRLDERLRAIAPLGDVIAFAPPVATTTLASVTERGIANPFGDAAVMAHDLTVVGRHGPRRITVVTAAGPAWGSVNTIAAAGPAGLLAGWARRAARTVPVSLLGLMPRDDTGELADADRPLFEQSGLSPLTAGDTAAILRTSLLAGPGERTAALVDLPRYVRLCQDLAPRAFLGSLAVRPAGSAFGRRLAELSEQARRDAVLDKVIAAAADALGLAAPELDIDRGFFDLGMDSVMALAIRTRLEDDLGLELPATLTFEYPTVAELADYLLGEMAAEPPAENANEPVDVLAAEMAAAERVLISGAGSTHD